MEQLSFFDELQHSLNVAFSVNYMVLDNFRHVDPSNHKGVFSSADIFGEKTRKQKTYDSLYHDYAKTRNEVYAHLQEFFDSYNFPNCFNENAKALVELYNDVYHENLSVRDVFSETEIADISILEQFANDVENGHPNVKNGPKCYYALNQFALFYEQYKIWLSAYEIFKTLQDDITSRGSKSLIFGKPTNDNVFLIDKETYKSFITPILNFAMDEEKHLEKEKISLTKKISAGHKELEEDLSVILSVLLAIKLIYFSDNLVRKRFEYANQKPKPKRKIDAILDTFLSKVVFNETDFEVDKIYIHKYEILDLINALTIFPQYDKLVNKLTSIVQGSQHDLSKFSPKKESTLS